MLTSPGAPPRRFTIKDFAELVVDKTKSNSTIVNKPATRDDPQQRKPDITVAKENIGWEPKVWPLPRASTSRMSALNARPE